MIKQPLEEKWLYLNWVNSAVLLALYGDLEDLFSGDLKYLFGVTFHGDFLRMEAYFLQLFLAFFYLQLLKEKQPLITKLMQSHSYSNRCCHFKQVASKRHKKNVPYLQEYKWIARANQ